MSEGGNEFGRTFFRFLAQIAEREKTKAIERDDYGGAVTATILEGFCREVEHVFK
jgi:hypothetical protein